jgi:hypothetical protein
LEDPNNTLIKNKTIWEIKLKKYIKSDICAIESLNKLFYIKKYVVILNCLCRIFAHFQVQKFFPKAGRLLGPIPAWW